jgi:ubiquinone biosynthesis protein Coq4
MTAIALNEAQHQAVMNLSWFERWTRGVKALVEVGRDPDRTDKVLEAYEHLNAGSEVARTERFYALKGARLLRAQDRTIDSQHIDFEKLLQLPADTLGYQYAKFMTDRNLTPDAFLAEGKLSEQSYMLKRMRQTHDIWHVVTGYETTVPGELELQAFTFGQVGIPSALLLVMFGALRWMMSYGPSLVVKVAKAMIRGRRAAPLAATPWEDLWSVPVTDVRAQLAL